MDNNYKLYVFSSSTNEFKEIDIENNDMVTVFSIENIKDITTRKDTITKDIILKGTKRNNKILGHLYNISRFTDDSFRKDLGHNFKANRYIKCVLLENNIQILKGDLLIRSVDIQDNNITYEGCITGVFMSFFNDIKERNLNELDSINDILTYSFANVQDSWLSTYFNNNKYVYPSVDYGEDERKGDSINQFDNAFDFKNFRPAIKVKSYLDAIFQGFRYDSDNKKYTQWNADNTLLNKYSFTSSFLNNEDFKRLIIPNNDEFLSQKVNKKVSFSFANQTENRYGLLKGCFLLNENNPIDDNFSIPYAENFTYLNIGGTTKYTGDNYTRTIQPKDKNIKTNIRIQAKIGMSQSTVGTWKIGLCDISQSKDISENNMKFYTTFSKVVTSSGIEILIDFKINDNVDISGQYIFCYVRQDQTGNNIEAQNLNFSNLKITFGEDNISVYPLTLMDNYLLKNTIPKDIKILDFFKSIMTMFNLYMVENPDKENDYIIEPYNTFYTDTITLNPSKAIDWTNKIDFDNYKILTNINLPKSYKYSFTEDSDMMNDFYKNRYTENYGTKIINDSKGYGDTKESTIIFSPTINISTSLDNKKLPIIYKADGFLIGKKKPFQSKIRILYFNGERSTNTYSIHYRGQEIQKISKYGYTSMLRVNTTNEVTDILLFDLPKEFFTDDNITTNDNLTLFSKYHYQQIKDITDDNLILLEAKVYLNEIDIQNLDFRKPIFLSTENGNSYFKLLEVEYLNNRTASNVKLQKIIV